MNEKTDSNKRKTEFISGMRAGVPIALGYFAVSFAFGLLGTEGGLPVFQTVLISALNLTSAGQFAGLTVMLAHGSFMELALTQLVINLRYMLMSFSLSQKIEKHATILQRLTLSFGITDEIFAVSSAHEGDTPPAFVYGAMAVSWPGWVGGTFLGAALGSILPQIVLNALSVALYGMFVALVFPTARKERAVAYTALGAMALSTLFHVLPALNRVSGGFVIIIATILSAGAAAVFFPVEEGAT